MSVFVCISMYIYAHVTERRGSTARLPLHPGHCTGVHYCITALLHDCITALPHCCIAALLHYCITALLHYCMTALLHYPIAALLHYCITALLHYCITALLHYSITPLLIVFDWLQVDDKEVFRVCMEYFEFLGKSLYEERCVCMCAYVFVYLALLTQSHNRMNPMSRGHRAMMYGDLLTQVPHMLSSDWSHALMHRTLIGRFASQSSRKWPSLRRCLLWRMTLAMYVYLD